MKKSVIITVLGIALAASSALAQGNIEIGNYQGAYNPVVWGSGGGIARAGLPVLSTEGVTLNVWYAAGSVADASLLVQGPVLPWDLVNQGNGYPGYYSFTTIPLPSAGTFTFQIRASGNSAFGPVDTGSSRSVLFQDVANAITDPPTPPNRGTGSIGLIVAVPEPSTFALIGLGLAGLLISRRRS